MNTVSVVIPVKDGERYLGEVLAALAREGADEVVVIDSGSRDRSVEITRRAGVELIEVPPEAFGHGRTRNLGVERSTGDLICLLTQDATPVPGWLDAYREAFAMSSEVGAAYGPHLARPGASPMIARELSEFFATFSPSGQAVLQKAGAPAFLSNVNACYRRSCWEELRFPDIAYAEDQAFGAALLASGWLKVYHPRAAVLHSHDYGTIGFMRRYFDEYRGLRESIGHVEPFSVRGTLRHTRMSVSGDARWLRQQDATVVERARWSLQATAHHGGRRVFSALGSRAERLPPRVQRAISLEGRDGTTSALHSSDTSAGSVPDVSLAPAVMISPVRDHEFYEPIAKLWDQGPVRLLDPVPGMADRRRLRIAMVIPAFSRGSGGHSLLFEVLRRLERRGHICSVWVYEYGDRLKDVAAAVLRHDIIDYFGPLEAPVYKGFGEWHGTDVVMATGWQTVHAVLGLDRTYARVYVVNDHEPEFYATSTESALARDTYRQGLHCIAGSPWLRDLLIEQYGATAEAFEYGVDHDIYRPQLVARRRDTIVYYARQETPRRAVAIGLMALAELHRRRPDTRIVLFGTRDPVDVSFPYEHRGILSPRQLALLFSEATVGLCLSLTNFSLMPKEMLACGLPCVELAGVGAETVFGDAGPLELAPLRPAAIADALERLLIDRELWEARSRDGVAFVAPHTWDRATDQVEAQIRRALRSREARHEE